MTPHAPDLVRRFEFERWPRPAAADVKCFIWRLVIGPHLLIDWQLARVQEEPLPPNSRYITSVWKPKAGESLLRLDVYEEASRQAAELRLLDLMADFQSPRIRRDVEAKYPLFRYGDDTTLAFAHGNLAFFAANAERKIVPLGNVLAGIDRLFTAGPTRPAPVAPALKLVEPTDVRVKSPVPLAPEADYPLPCWYRVETILGDVRRDGAHLVYENVRRRRGDADRHGHWRRRPRDSRRRTFRVLAQSEPGRDPFPVPQTLTWAMPIWASVLRRNGAHARGVFDLGGLEDRRESGSVPLGTVTQGRLALRNLRSPPCRPRVCRPRAEIVASECVWSVESPALAGGQPAIVEVEWVGKGPLSVLLGGWLLTGVDSRVWVAWCSPQGEVRATAESNHVFTEVLELTPEDGKGPQPGNVLFVRHIRERQEPWEVLLGLRF